MCYGISLMPSSEAYAPPEQCAEAQQYLICYFPVLANVPNTTELGTCSPA